MYFLTKNKINDMAESPAKKRQRLASNSPQKGENKNSVGIPIALTPTNKRKLDLEEPICSPRTVDHKKCTPTKKQKMAHENPKDTDDRASATKRAFIEACKKVSFEKFFDYKTRFLLFNIPGCVRQSPCSHQENRRNNELTEIPDYAKEGFRIDFKTHMWSDALDVCRMTLSHKYYLPSDMLQNIVDIILNAHPDPESGYSIPFLLDKCQQTLSLMYNTHPPCVISLIRNTYKRFLLDPLIKSDNLYIDKSKYDSDRGLVKYCFNRLEFELSDESNDGPLVDINENVPNEMKLTVQGLTWQKYHFEIFETLDRHARIERIMCVLGSIVELMKYDAAIWHARHSHNQGKHIMRSNKLLMAFVLWSDNVLYTGAVNGNCRQIIKLFIIFIHLNYPECIIRDMTAWFNLMVQSFYICERDSQSDYPNTGKYCNNFALEMVKILKDYPHSTILKVLERTKPAYIKHSIGVQLLRLSYDTKENDTAKIILNFLKQKAWREYSFSNQVIKRPIEIKKPSKIKRLYQNFERLSSLSVKAMNIKPKDELCYKKLHVFKVNSEWCLDSIIQLIYLSLESYVDTYSIEKLQDYIDSSGVFENNSLYCISENFVKLYRSICETLKAIVITLMSLKKSDSDYKYLKVFEKISVLNM